MSFCKCKHGLRSRGVSRGVKGASTCKTFSSREIHKKFVKILPEGIYFSSIGNIKDPKSDCHDKSQLIPQIIKTVVVIYVIPNSSLVTPLGLSTLHNVQLAIKATNLPNINISHFKNCTKIIHDIDILCCQSKTFH
jgi:hypothetical protein